MSVVVGVIALVAVFKAMVTAITILSICGARNVSWPPQQPVRCVLTTDNVATNLTYH